MKNTQEFKEKKMLLELEHKLKTERNEYERETNRLLHEKALERIRKARNYNEKFEEIKFMQELRKNFIDLKNQLKDNIKLIDSNKPLNDVFEDVKKEINKIL